jgi:hypothetical protein
MLLHVGDSLRGDYLNPARRLARDAAGRSPTRCLRNGTRPRGLHRGALEKTPPEPRRGDRGMKTWTPKATKRQGRSDAPYRLRPLGPVVQRWLLALHQHLQFHDDGSTVALFCARAGVRIAELYDLFLRDRRHRASRTGCSGFPASPLPRGLRHPAGTDPQHRASDPGIPPPALRDLVTGLLRQCPDLLSDIDLQDRSLDAHGHNFAGWMTVNGPGQRRVREFLAPAPPPSHLSRRLLDGRRRALLIDSGWQGTTQSLLTCRLPDTHWRGLYFGRILTPAHDPAHRARIASA